MRKLLATCMAWSLAALPAVAYPNSVILAQTGETKSLLQAGGLMYTVFYNRNLFGVNGLNAGVPPTLPYGNLGISLGDAEVAFDVISQAVLNPPNKPAFNANVGLLTV